MSCKFKSLNCLFWLQYFSSFWVFEWLLYSISQGALSAQCLPHFCIQVERDNDRISSVQVHFLKAITNTFTVKIFTSDSVPLAMQSNIAISLSFSTIHFLFPIWNRYFYFFGLTKIYIQNFSWLGQKQKANSCSFPTMLCLLLRLYQSYS